jgi:hypothetical protein
MPENHDQVILIRAHRLDPGLVAAMLRYAGVAGHDLFVLYDNDRRDFEPFGLDPLLMTAADLKMSDLLYTPGSPHFGIWKNGDYALYHAASHLKRTYKYYWMIEYDVFLNFDDLNEFFDVFRACDDDFIAPYCGPKPPEWLWSGNMSWITDTVYGCFFPVVRLSAPALHHCRLARLYYGYKFRELGLRGASWPHCEAFVPTQLVQAGFAVSDINNHGRIFCDIEWFHARTEAAYSLADPIFRQPDQKLYHPVYA